MSVRSELRGPAVFLRDLRLDEAGLADSGDKVRIEPVGVLHRP
ncbi:MAG TPA: hypothetical protein VJB16_01920 [archaeon]|nr:hypothetical protein [archaeon]